MQARNLLQSESVPTIPTKPKFSPIDQRRAITPLATTESILRLRRLETLFLRNLEGIL